MQFGATHAFASAEKAAPKINELTWGQGADQALVTVGVVDDSVVRSAFDAVGKGGTVVITGQAHPEAVTIQIPSALLVRDEKVIRGSQFGSSNPQYDIVNLSHSTTLASSSSTSSSLSVTRSNRKVNEGYQDLRDGKIIRGVIDLTDSITAPTAQRRNQTCPTRCR